MDENQLNSLKRMGSVFSAISPLMVEDVNKAIPIIEDVLIHQEIKKPLFRDLLTGLKVLILSMNDSEDIAPFCIMIKWLQLHLEVANAINPNYDHLRGQFEKYIPVTILYVATALHYKPRNVEKYHFRVLQLSLKLLDTVKEATLRNVVYVKPGLISDLWRPINFVGDFNTQLCVLHLTTKLLKSVDDNKQKQVLDEICSESSQLLKDSIANAIEVANYQAGKFERACRELLNNFNINLSKNVLVYSLRCKTIKYGPITSFYKPLNCDYLWIDLNYCPRTLTFNCRYRATNKDKFVRVDVCVLIEKIELNKRTLTAFPKGLPNFSIDSFNEIVNSTLSHNFEFELLMEEALRLKENHDVLDYYNNSINQATSENIIKPIKHKLHANMVGCPPENFQKSYSILVGDVDTREEECLSRSRNSSAVSIPVSPICDNITIKLASLSHMENTKLIEKLTQENCSNSRSEYNPLAQTAINKPDLLITCDTPKSSHCANNARDEPYTEIPQLIKPTAAAKRRIFMNKTFNQNGQNKDAKKLKTTVKRYRNTIQRTTPPKRKQINKVKPMNHLAKNDGDPEIANQEYVENGGIINITNFLNDVHESAAIFNDDERRIILQNINRINNNLDRSVKKFFRSDHQSNENNKSSNTNFDIFNDSYAEPGKSYKNFKLFRSKAENLPVMKTKRRAGCQSRKKTKKLMTNENRSVCSKQNKQILKVPKISEGIGCRIRKRRVNTSQPKNIAKTANNLETEPKKDAINLHITNHSIINSMSSIKNGQRNNKSHSNENQTDVKHSSLKLASIKNDFRLFQRKPKLKSKNEVQPCIIFSSSSEDDTDVIITPKVVRNTSPTEENLDDIQEVRHDISMHQIPPDSNGRKLILRNRISISSPVTSIDDFQEELTIINNTQKTSMQNDKNDDFRPITPNTQSQADNEKIDKNPQAVSTRIIASDGKDISEGLTRKSSGNSYENIGSFISTSNISPVRCRSTTLDEEIQVISGKQNVDNHSSLLNDTPNICERKNSSHKISNDLSVSRNQSDFIENIPSKTISLYHSDYLLHRHRSDDESDDGELEIAACNSSCTRASSQKILKNMSPNLYNLSFNRITARSMSRIARRSMSTPRLTKTIQSRRVTRTSITTHRLISTDVFFKSPQCQTSMSDSFQGSQNNAKESSVTYDNQMIPHDSSVSKFSELQFNTISNYMLTLLERNEEQDNELHNPINEDVFQILEDFKQNINFEFEKLKSSERKNKFVSSMKELIEISRNLMGEAKIELAELKETENEIKRLMQQFLCLWKVYKTKSERFTSFRRRVEEVLRALSENNLEEDIHLENEQFSINLHNMAKEIQSKVWQEFLKNTTENFVKNISSLSTL